MVEKRVCYVCGEAIGENDKLCPYCGAEAPPIKVNFNKFVDETFSDNADNQNWSPQPNAPGTGEFGKGSDDLYDSLFFDEKPKEKSAKPYGSKAQSNSGTVYSDGGFDFLGNDDSEKTAVNEKELNETFEKIIDEALEECGEARNINSISEKKENAIAFETTDLNFTDAEGNNTSSTPFVTPAPEVLFPENTTLVAPEKSNVGQNKPEETVFDEIFSSSEQTAQKPAAPAVSPSISNNEDDYGFGFDAPAPVQRPEPIAIRDTPAYDPFGDYSGGSDVFAEKQKNSERKSPEKKKDNKPGSSNLIVPVIVIAAVLVISLITIIAVVLIHSSNNRVAYEPDYDESYNDDYGDYDNSYDETEPEQEYSYYDPYSDSYSDNEDDYQYSESNDVPYYWSAYSSGMVPENRTYVITLPEDYNILFRSTPYKLGKESPDYNEICKIPTGTEVYVEYIYDGKWAAFTYNGMHGFSSLYANNDPTDRMIMTPK